MLARIRLILGVFLVAGVAILLFWINIQSKKIKSLQEAKNTLEMNNNVLLTRIKREHDDKVEYSRKAQELEDLAKRAVNFDWNRDISNDELVIWLRENSIRVQGSRKRAD